MEITLNVNINAPALVDLIKQAMNVSSLKQPGNQAPGGTAVPTGPETVSGAEKSAPKAGKAKPAAAASGAPAPAVNVAPAAAENGVALTREQVKARLADYSADKRFGVNGVIALLANYGVQRVTDLAEKDFVAVKAEVDAALGAGAAAANPLD